MWLTDLSPTQATDILGPDGPLIVGLTRRAVAGQPTSLPPGYRLTRRPHPTEGQPPGPPELGDPGLVVLAPEEAIARYGPNGLAVALWFTTTFEAMPWDRPEDARRSAPGPVVPYAERHSLAAQLGAPLVTLLNTSDDFEAWQQRGSPPVSEWLSEVWDEVRTRIERVTGSHMARLLAYRMAGELTLPELDRHLFLDLLPWVWAGHVPLGWVGAPPRGIVLQR